MTACNETVEERSSKIPPSRPAWFHVKKRFIMGISVKEKTHKVSHVVRRSVDVLLARLLQEAHLEVPVSVRQYAKRLAAPREAFIHVIVKLFTSQTCQIIETFCIVGCWFGLSILIFLFFFFIVSIFNFSLFNREEREKKRTDSLLS